MNVRAKAFFSLQKEKKKHHVYVYGLIPQHTDHRDHISYPPMHNP
jgi:hypothetical protein